MPMDLSQAFQYANQFRGYQPQQQTLNMADITRQLAAFNPAMYNDPRVMAMGITAPRAGTELAPGGQFGMSAPNFSNFMPGGAGAGGGTNGLASAGGIGGAGGAGGNGLAGGGSPPPPPPPPPPQGDVYRPGGDYSALYNSPQAQQLLAQARQWQQSALDPSMWANPRIQQDYNAFAGGMGATGVSMPSWAGPFRPQTAPYLNAGGGFGQQMRGVGGQGYRPPPGAGRYVRPPQGQSDGSGNSYRPPLSYGNNGVPQYGTQQPQGRGAQAPGNSVSNYGPAAPGAYQYVPQDPGLYAQPGPQMGYERAPVDWRSMFMPRYATGTDYVPATGTAVLEQGEMVVPVQKAEALRQQGVSVQEPSQTVTAQPYFGDVNETPMQQPLAAPDPATQLAATQSPRAQKATVTELAAVSVPAALAAATANETVGAPTTAPASPSYTMDDILAQLKTAQGALPTPDLGEQIGNTPNVTQGLAALNPAWGQWAQQQVAMWRTRGIDENAAWQNVLQQAAQGQAMSPDPNGAPSSAYQNMQQLGQQYRTMSAAANPAQTAAAQASATALQQAVAANPGTTAAAPASLAATGGLPAAPAQPANAAVAGPVTAATPQFSLQDLIMMALGMPITPAAQQAPAAGSGLAPVTQRYANALPAPNQIVGRNWMNLDPDTQQFLLGAYEAAGYGAPQVQYAIQQGLPGRQAWARGNYAAIR